MIAAKKWSQSNFFLQACRSICALCYTQSEITTLQRVHVATIEILFAEHEIWGLKMAPEVFS